MQFILGAIYVTLPLVAGMRRLPSNQNMATDDDQQI